MAAPGLERPTATTATTATNVRPRARTAARRVLFALPLALALAGTAARAPAAVYYPGQWVLTEYWITDERAGAGDRRPVRIRDHEGQTLAWSCPRFLDDLSMEGTGRTWDGRLLNWESRVNGRACFVELDRDSYPYGMGVAGYALVPYRSLAVDRRFIPLGHTVEIPGLAGMPLPDGSRHDGCFVAVDGGGAINGHHIDLFLPSEAAYVELARAGYLPTRVRGVIADSPRCAYAVRYAQVPGPTAPLLPH
jgi:3D (Asp-Asp-Asp) domain-containing protein